MTKHQTLDSLVRLLANKSSEVTAAISALVASLVAREGGVVFCAVLPSPLTRPPNLRSEVK